MTPSLLKFQGLLVIVLLSLFSCKPSVEMPKLSSEELSQSSIGVRECDTYWVMYQRCLTTAIPERVRPSYEFALNQAVNYWKNMSGTPEGKASLKRMCELAYEGGRATLKAFGCSW